MKIANDKLISMAEKLKKGDYISPTTIQKIIKYKPTDKKYALALLDVKTTLAKLMEENGNPATLTAKGDGIEVLTDSQATEYNHRSFCNHLQGSVRAHTRMTQVDAAQLNEAEQKQHAVRMALQDARLSAALAIKQRAIAGNEKIRQAMAILNS